MSILIVSGHTASEKCSENVLELLLLIVTLILSLSSESRFTVLFRTIPIICCPFLRIDQSTISIAHFFKHLFGAYNLLSFTFNTVLIRMEPKCKFFVSLFDFRLWTCFSQTKYIIVIFFAHVHTNLFFHFCLLFVLLSWCWHLLFIIFMNTSDLFNIFKYNHEETSQSSYFMKYWHVASILSFSYWVF